MTIGTIRTGSERMRCIFLATLTLAAVGACSTVEKLNPFSTASTASKPADLVTIKPSAELNTIWKASIGASGTYIFSPAVVDRSVYVAARDGAIVRFDAGKQVWRIKAGQPISGGVGSDGSLVVVGTDKGEVMAFDAVAGALKWRARVSSEILAAPAVADGLVIVRSGDSRVFGFDVADGKRRWVYQRSTPALSLRSNVGVVLAGKMTLVGYPGGKLVAIANNNGAAAWELSIALPKGATELERVADITSSPVINGNIVCAAAFQGRVSCVDAGSGHVLWSRDMSSSAGLDMDSRYVYITDDKGSVHALDRNSGASVWKQDKLFMRGVSRPIALGNFVGVGDYSGVIHLLRRDDGEFAARMTTDGSRIAAEPVHYGNGFLVQTVGGGVYAVETR